jgi:uridine phosphorylase
MNKIAESELILNADGSIYHLNLHPHELADTVITVGDPDRVPIVSKFFDSIEIKKQKREFVTHTGHYKGKRITVISTGIGTDNIDIAFNELDALVNINLKTREINPELKSLQIIRIGTSGALHADIPVDSFVFSSFGLGLDGVLNFYVLENTPEETAIIDAFREHYPSHGILSRSYLTKVSPLMSSKVGEGLIQGMTASCSGFYAPQGRILRYQLARPDFIPCLNAFSFKGQRITNFEMETGAMYGLARVLGHDVCSVNAIVANRITLEHTHRPEETMDEMIGMVLDRLAV